MSNKQPEVFHCEFCTLDAKRVEEDRTITIIDDMNTMHTHQMQVCHFCYTSETFADWFNHWENDAIKPEDEYWVSQRVVAQQLDEPDIPAELTTKEIQERLVKEMVERIGEDKVGQIENHPLPQKVQLLRPLLQKTLEEEEREQQEFLEHYELSAEEKRLLEKLTKLTIDLIAEEMLVGIRKQPTTRVVEIWEFEHFYDDISLFSKDIQAKVKQAAKNAFETFKLSLVPEFIKQNSEEEIAKLIADWCFAKKYPPSSVYQYYVGNKIPYLHFPQQYLAKFEACMQKARGLVQQMREKALQDKDSQEKAMLPQLIEECYKWVKEQGSPKLTRDSCKVFLAQKQLMLNKILQNELYVKVNEALTAGKKENIPPSTSTVEVKKAQGAPAGGIREQTWVECPHCKAPFKGTGGLQNHLRAKHPVEYDRQVEEEAKAWRDQEIKRAEANYQRDIHWFEDFEKDHPRGSSFITQNQSPEQRQKAENYLKNLEVLDAKQRTEHFARAEKQKVEAIARIENLYIIRIADSKASRLEKQGDKEGALQQLQRILQIYTEMGYKDPIKKTKERISKLQNSIGAK